METKDIKKIYNSIVPEKHKGNYEYNRWFKNPILRAGYDMTRRSIEYHLFPANGLKIKNYLELGPGAGTWTKLFAEKYPDAILDIVDISKEMLKISKKELQQYRNINFFEADFLEFQPIKKYDFFFSSRAVEYFPRKSVLIEKICGLMEPCAKGFIITKTPKYLRKRLLRQSTSDFHRGQIHPNQMGKMLARNGCRNIEIYPAVMSIPVLRSPLLNKLAHKMFYKHRLNFISKFFAESYCVKFKKI